MKAELADEKASFGVHAPPTSGVYRVVNSVFSRLQILSSKVTTLEKRLQAASGIRFESPGPETSRIAMSRASVAPVTPITKIAGMARPSPGRTGSPGHKSSPSRSSPLRRTMLDEKLDPWEAEEMVRDFQKKRDFRRRIGEFLRDTQPIFTEAGL